MSRQRIETYARFNPVHNRMCDLPDATVLDGLHIAKTGGSNFPKATRVVSILPPSGKL